MWIVETCENRLQDSGLARTQQKSGSKRVLHRDFLNACTLSYLWKSVHGKSVEKGQ
jgi:hypothetical protein